MNIDNKIIIIGCNHHNTLGVIRSLGENKIYPYVIITGKNNSYIKKSKYIKKYWITDEDESNILNVLNDNFNNGKLKPFLIPTSDFAAQLIDSNIEKLKEKFIIPNIKNKSGMIDKYMNKEEQYKFIKKLNIDMPYSEILDLRLITEEYDYKSYPCILKPVVSVEGKKSDIKICQTKKELNKSIKDLKELNYSRILIQKYISMDYECDIPGCSDGKEVLIPAIIKKKRIYPIKRGSTSYASVVPSSNLDLTSLKTIIKSIGYNGIFDIEIFVCGNQIVINEINFRNSAVSYALTKEKIYIVLDWILLNLNKKVEYKKDFKEYFFMVENLEIKQLKDNNITFVKWIKEFLKTKKLMILNIKDLKPFIYKFIYSRKNKE